MPTTANNAVRFKFDADKALEVILYISKRAEISDLYHVLKILYFADKDHLSKYGRFICGDTYAALKHGPVPDYTYNLIKYIRDQGKDYFSCINPALGEKLQDIQYGSRDEIIPLRDADINYLSESDFECLDKSIEENGSLSFDELKEKSHDEAFKEVGESDCMSVELIAKTLPNAEELLEYLTMEFS